MLHNRVIFSVFLFVYLIMISCGSSPYSKKESADRKTNPYFPVTEGSKWEFASEAPGEETVIHKVEISLIKNAGDDKIAGFSAFPFFGKDSSASLRVKPDGTVYLTDMNQKENMLIPGPDNLKKDYVWEFENWRGVVASANETVKTKYGTFENCIYLSYSIYFTFSAELWLAKDAGIVKWGYNRTNPPTLKPEYYVLTKMNIAK